MNDYNKHIRQKQNKYREIIAKIWTSEASLGEKEVLSRLVRELDKTWGSMVVAWENLTEDVEGLEDCVRDGFQDDDGEFWESGYVLVERE